MTRRVLPRTSLSCPTENMCFPFTLTASETSVKTGRIPARKTRRIGRLCGNLSHHGFPTGLCYNLGRFVSSGHGTKEIHDCKERSMRSGARRMTDRQRRNIFDRSQGRSIAGVIVMRVTSESGNEIEVTNADPPRIEAIRRRETRQPHPTARMIGDQYFVSAASK